MAVGKTKTYEMCGSENLWNFECAEEQGKRFPTFQTNVLSLYSKAKQSMNNNHGLQLEIYKSGGQMGKDKTG
jgi:hypothetical protein